MASVIKITDLPESRVRVDAEVPADEVERRMHEAARELGRTLRIDGFRKGKVPPAVVIRRLGRKAVLEEALRTSLAAWYVDAIDGAGIATVGSPDVAVGEVPPAGQPLSIMIEIGVRPKAVLGAYRGLEVGRREPVVRDGAIDAELDRMRNTFATLGTVERAAQTGDHVVIDYLGRIDGEPFAGGEARDQALELGSRELIPGFEEQLVGARAGERRQVDVTFPAGAGELAGRAASFEVAVHEVKAKQLPELDDDFASDASEFDTLAQLRDEIAARLLVADERAAQRDYERAVLDAVVAGAQIDVPDALVHARAHEALDETLRALARQGVSKESYLRVLRKDEEELAHDAAPEAAATLRREAVLVAVVEAEQIRPSDDDVRRALEPAAASGDGDVDALFEQLRANGRLEEMRTDLATRRALELIVAAATPIPAAQAEARAKLWTPDKGEEPRPGKLWTPGS
jgi:trigger factor